MRILPRSLFGRLVLVLLGGLVAAQLLSAYILLRDRGQTLYQSIRADLVERTAGIVRLLDALPSQDRRRLLPLLSTPATRIRLARSAADMPEQDTGQGAAARVIERRLRERLPPGSEVLVALAGPPEEGAVPQGMQGMHRRHMAGRGGMAGPWAYLHGVQALAQSFYIQAQLSDGSWVQFERRIPEDLFDQPTRLLLTLAVLLASVVLLSLLAVRWVVGPLRDLRRAAEALGRDIHRPPLKESGPLEVAETARAFNTMQQRIQSFVEDRARILAAVSHDLKTPLTRLRLRTDLLDDEELRTKLRADLDGMEAMVGATLDFMRGTESREASRRLDLMTLLETIQEDAREAGWSVSLQGKVAQPIQARPTAIKRCIANLVENAARYGGGAEIHASDDGTSVRILIQDRGPGIPEDLLGKVFDPFFRIESSRARHTGGTGLGLGIARNIARGHGGDLVLRNRPGGGLTAELTLPR
jgi:signal transduction histidine kinase